MTYNNYFPNSRFNLSFNANGILYTDQITSNTIQVLVPIGNTGKNRSINEVHYVNLSGTKSIGGNYNISKQLADRRYNIALNGRISYGYSVAMSNDQIFHQTTWDFNERFGPRITPTDNVEVNPFIGTRLTRTFATSRNATSTEVYRNSLGIDGRFYFFKTYQVHYDAQKQIIRGITGNNNSPLIINAGFQKEFGDKRAFTLTFDMFDLLHQNNYIDQTITTTGITNTISSSLSRYFLVGFRLNLQKWSGRPSRNGRQMQRRGDGSFIYN